MECAKETQRRKRNELVLANIGLVRTLIKRLWQGNEEEDLFQVGVIGLIKAAANYDPGRGTAFSTYAVPAIIGEVRDYLRQHNLIKVSRDLKDKAAKLKHMQSRFYKATGREPTMEEIAAELKLDREEIAMVHELSTRPISLEQKLPGSQDAGHSLENLFGASGQEEAVERLSLKESLEKLPYLEKRLITLRYFTEKTQVETGRELNLTQVQVSRLERKVLQKLRTGLM